MYSRPRRLNRTPAADYRDPRVVAVPAQARAIRGSILTLLSMEHLSAPPSWPMDARDRHRERGAHTPPSVHRLVRFKGNLSLSPSTILYLILSRPSRRTAALHPPPSPGSAWTSAVSAVAATAPSRTSCRPPGRLYTLELLQSSLLSPPT
jgi:hypothetical protein